MSLSIIKIFLSTTILFIVNSINNHIEEITIHPIFINKIEYNQISISQSKHFLLSYSHIVNNINTNIVKNNLYLSFTYSQIDYINICQVKFNITDLHEKDQYHNRNILIYDYKNKNIVLNNTLKVVVYRENTNNSLDNDQSICQFSIYTSIQEAVKLKINNLYTENVYNTYTYSRSIICNIDIDIDKDKYSNQFNNKTDEINYENHYIQLIYSSLLPLTDLNYEVVYINNINIVEVFNLNTESKGILLSKVNNSLSSSLYINIYNTEYRSTVFHINELKKLNYIRIYIYEYYSYDNQTLTINRVKKDFDFKIIYSIISSPIQKYYQQMINNNSNNHLNKNIFYDAFHLNHQKESILYDFYHYNNTQNLNHSHSHSLLSNYYDNDKILYIYFYYSNFEVIIGLISGEEKRIKINHGDIYDIPYLNEVLYINITCLFDSYKNNTVPYLKMVIYNKEYSNQYTNLYSNIYNFDIYSSQSIFTSNLISNSFLIYEFYIDRTAFQSLILTLNTYNYTDYNENQNEKQSLSYSNVTIEAYQLTNGDLKRINLKTEQSSFNMSNILSYSTQIKDEDYIINKSEQDVYYYIIYVSISYSYSNSSMIERVYNLKLDLNRSNNTSQIYYNNIISKNKTNNSIRIRNHIDSTIENVIVHINNTNSYSYIVLLIHISPYNTYKPYDTNRILINNKEISYLSFKIPFLLDSNMINTYNITINPLLEEHVLIYDIQIQIYNTNSYLINVSPYSNFIIHNYHSIQLDKFSLYLLLNKNNWLYIDVFIYSKDLYGIYEVYSLYNHNFNLNAMDFYSISSIEMMINNGIFDNYNKYIMMYYNRENIQDLYINIITYVYKERVESISYHNQYGYGFDYGYHYLIYSNRLYEKTSFESFESIMSNIRKISYILSFNMSQSEKILHFRLLKIDFPIDICIYYIGDVINNSKIKVKSIILNRSGYERKNLFEFSIKDYVFIKKVIEYNSNLCINYQDNEDDHYKNNYFGSSCLFYLVVEYESHSNDINTDNIYEFEFGFEFNSVTIHKLGHQYNNNSNKFNINDSISVTNQNNNTFYSNIKKIIPTTSIINQLNNQTCIDIFLKTDYMLRIEIVNTRIDNILYYIIINNTRFSSNIIEYTLNKNNNSKNIKSNIETISLCMVYYNDSSPESNKLISNDYHYIVYIHTIVRKEYKIYMNIFSNLIFPLEYLRVILLYSLYPHMNYNQNTLSRCELTYEGGFNIYISNKNSNNNHINSKKYIIKSINISKISLVFTVIDYEYISIEVLDDYSNSESDTVFPYNYQYKNNIIYNLYCNTTSTTNINKVEYIPNSIDSYDPSNINKDTFNIISIFNNKVIKQIVNKSNLNSFLFIYEYKNTISIGDKSEYYIVYNIYYNSLLNNKNTILDYIAILYYVSSTQLNINEIQKNNFNPFSNEDLFLISLDKILFKLHFFNENDGYLYLIIENKNKNDSIYDSINEITIERIEIMMKKSKLIDIVYSNYLDNNGNTTGNIDNNINIKRESYSYNKYSKWKLLLSKYKYKIDICIQVLFTKSTINNVMKYERNEIGSEINRKYQFLLIISIYNQDYMTLNKTVLSRNIYSNTKYSYSLYEIINHINDDSYLIKIEIMTKYNSYCFYDIDIYQDEILLMTEYDMIFLNNNQGQNLSLIDNNLLIDYNSIIFIHKDIYSINSYLNKNNDIYLVFEDILYNHKSPIYEFNIYLNWNIKKISFLILMNTYNLYTGTIGKSNNTIIVDSLIDYKILYPIINTFPYYINVDLTKAIPYLIDYYFIIYIELNHDDQYESNLYPSISIDYFNLADYMDIDIVYMRGVISMLSFNSYFRIYLDNDNLSTSTKEYSFLCQDINKNNSVKEEKKKDSILTIMNIKLEINSYNKTFMIDGINNDINITNNETIHIKIYDEIINLNSSLKEMNSSQSKANTLIKNISSLYYNRLFKDIIEENNIQIKVYSYQKANKTLVFDDYITFIGKIDIEYMNIFPHRYIMIILYNKSFSFFECIYNTTIFASSNILNITNTSSIIILYNNIHLSPIVNIDISYRNIFKIMKIDNSYSIDNQIDSYNYHISKYNILFILYNTVDVWDYHIFSIIDGNQLIINKKSSFSYIIFIEIIVGIGIITLIIYLLYIAIQKNLIKLKITRKINDDCSVVITTSDIDSIKNNTFGNENFSNEIELSNIDDK